MAIYEFTLTRPDHLAQEAENAGLLTTEAIGRLLRDEVRRTTMNKLFDAIDQVTNVAVPPLTECEVEGKIVATHVSRNTSFAIDYNPE